MSILIYPYSIWDLGCCCCYLVVLRGREKQSSSPMVDFPCAYHSWDWTGAGSKARSGQFSLVLTCGGQAFSDSNHHCTSWRCALAKVEGDSQRQVSDPDNLMWDMGISTSGLDVIPIAIFFFNFFKWIPGTCFMWVIEIELKLFACSFLLKLSAIYFLWHFNVVQIVKLEYDALNLKCKVNLSSKIMFPLFSSIK